MDDGGYIRMVCVVDGGYIRMVCVWTTLFPGPATMFARQPVTHIGHNLTSP